MARIVIGLSGGVDSALAAALLQERGWDVVGCFLKVDLTTHDSRLTTCPWREDLPMAHRVAAHLGIPLIVNDVSAAYEREVLDPMVAMYRAGGTPNPDILCNRWVKFDALIAVAREVGAERIATGHYARVVRRPEIKSTNGSQSTNPQEAAGSSLRARRERSDPNISSGPMRTSVELWRGVDHLKDQSYFLASLTQEQLAWCEFPLGEWCKEDVRLEAKRRDFPNWDRDSTSGVCFLGHVSLGDFLNGFSPSRAGKHRVLRSPRRVGGGKTPDVEERREGECESKKRPKSDLGQQATVITTTGEVLGTVPNAAALTIGQRVPLAGQPMPRYVVATRCSTPGVEQPRVVVSALPDDPARYTKEAHAVNPYWIGFSPPACRGSERGSFRCQARIRHRQEPIPCTVQSRTLDDRKSPALDSNATRIAVTFATPLTGVAPGQAIVFSDGDRILGSATIHALQHSNIL